MDLKRRIKKLEDKTGDNELHIYVDCLDTPEEREYIKNCKDVLIIKIEEPKDGRLNDQNQKS